MPITGIANKIPSQWSTETAKATKTIGRTTDIKQVMALARSGIFLSSSLKAPVGRPLGRSLSLPSNVGWPEAIPPVMVRTTSSCSNTIAIGLIYRRSFPQTPFRIKFVLLDRAAKLPERPSFIEPFCQFTCGYSLAMSLLARTLQNATTAAVARANSTTIS